MESEQLKNVVESLLFVSSKAMRTKELAKFLETEEALVQAALTELANERRDAGVIVLENNGEYQMATQPKNSTRVKNFLNAELREKLTDATVEVLAIIAYRQPISKAEVEAVRGVNSQYSIRHLLMRGLIEKIANPNDARSVLYQTTTEFLQHMGLASVKDLPEFEKLVEQIKLPGTPAVQEAGVSPDLAPAASQIAPREYTDPAGVKAQTAGSTPAGLFPEEPGSSGQTIRSGPTETSAAEPPDAPATAETAITASIPGTAAESPDFEASEDADEDEFDDEDEEEK